MDTQIAVVEQRVGEHSNRDTRARYSAVSLLAALLLAALWVIIPGHAQAQGTCSATYTITAGDNGSGLVAQIAAAFAGDTICIVPSGGNNTITLSNQIEITKSLTISGTGAANVIVSGNNATRVFNIIQGVNVTLQGLTVFGGAANGNGGGIRSAGALTLTAVSVVSNTAIGGGGGTAINGGGGLYVTSTLTIVDSTFISNSVGAGRDAGAILAEGGVTIRNSKFLTNTSGRDAGGIYVNGNYPLTVTDSEFIANQSNEDGGAVFALGAMTVDNVLFERNVAWYGGAIEHWSNGLGVISNSRFYTNTARVAGGGLITGRPLQLSNSIFRGNISEGTQATNSYLSGNAGALSVLGSSAVVDIINTDFLSNTAKKSGGAIYTEDYSLLTIRNGTFYSNTADYGGAILTEYHSSLTISNGTFYSNTADIEGGAIYTWISPVTISQSTIAENYAGSMGGALYITNAWSTSSYRSVVSETTFYSNTAYADGGAIYNQGRLLITNSTLTGNSAKQGGGLFGSYSVVSNPIYSYGAVLDMANVTVAANQAITGSGLYADAGGTMTSTNRITNTLLVNGIGGADIAGPGTVVGSHNLTGTLPMGALQDNGGSTWTMLPGAAAIDAGTNGGCPAADQRGRARPQGSVCDIGALEMADTRLSGLSIAPGLLVPAFISTTLEYTALVSYNGTPLILTPTASVGTYTVTVQVSQNGSPATPCSGSPISCRLAVGTNVITATVTAIDGTIKNYTISVTRAAPSNADLRTCIATHTITAGDNGSGLVAQIAAAFAGDTICIVPSGGNNTITLSRQIEITKSLIISGTGAADVVLSGNNVTRVFTITSNVNVAILGMTLRDGRVSGREGGGAIYSRSPLTVSDSALINNRVITAAADGGAINSLSTLTVINSEFLTNTATRDGGAINLQNNFPLIMANSDFIANESGEDGGAVMSAGPISMTNLLFERNVGWFGGAVEFFGTVPVTGTVINSRFYSNTARVAGGAVVATVPLLLTDSLFSGNVADGSQALNWWLNGQGGAIFMSGGGSDTLNITNTDFLSNSAEEEGGAIYSENTLTVRGSEFLTNTARLDGGAIYLDNYNNVGYPLVLESVQFMSNTAVSGGALYVWDGVGSTTITATTFVRNSSSSSGGALSLYGGGTVGIANTGFLSNTAKAVGGAIDSKNSLTVRSSEFLTNTAEQNGGAIFQSRLNSSRSYPLVLESVQFMSNTGVSGGALYVQDAPATITATTFVRNSSPSSGGALYYTSTYTLSIFSTDFYSNTAQDSSAGGGALFLYSSRATTMTDSTLAYNQAAAHGGAIYQGKGNMTMAGVTLAHNQAVARGGAIYGADPLQLVNTTLYSNTAGTDGGALFVEDNVYARNVTMSDNAATRGGGLYANGGGATVALTNTLVVNSAGGDLDGTAPLIGSHNLTGTLPMGALQDNGGSTWTMLPGAAAIDAGTNVDCPAADQRGMARPQGSVCDIGALEMADTRLSGLSIAPGLLVPAFISTTLEYTALVSYNGTPLILTPTASVGTYTVTVQVSQNGSAATPCSGSPVSCQLAVGTNVITVTVTAIDGTTRSYGVTITRASDASLFNLETTALNFAPVFTGTTYAYSATVGHALASTLVTATASFAPDNITLVVAANGGVPAACSGNPVNCPLATGSNVITATVTAADGTIKRYTITVTRAAPNNADLSALALSNAPLNPGFTAGNTSYTATVANSITGTAVTATLADAAATVQINGVAASSGVASAPIGLNAGTNVITVTATAADGTIKRYTITVTRAAPSNADLSALALSNAPLNPAFTAGNTAYTATVANIIIGVAVSATASDPGTSISAVTVTPPGGSPVPCPTAGYACPLAVGANLITVTVTAADGTTKSYTITVTRLPSSNAYLLSLALSNAPLNPAFTTGNTAYTATVANSITGVAVSAMASDPGASISAVMVTPPGGSPVPCPPAGYACPLAVGANLITVTVTSADGTIKLYTITVTRLPSSNADLLSLALSNAPLNPAFTAGNTAYTATVANSVTGVAVSATASDPGASISAVTVTPPGGSPVPCPPAGYACPLAVGANLITVTVTAADGTTKSYTITVTRLPLSNADLLSLALSNAPLNPAFTAGNTAYTATVANSVTGVAVSATASDPGASISAVTVTPPGGSPVPCPPAGYACPLAVGANLITVTVTAADGTTKSYTITVTRAEPRGAVAGVVFNDLNASGQLDAAEPGVASVPVELLANGGVVATTATDNDGAYLFDNLAPGGYVVRIVLPANFVAGNVERVVNAVAGVIVRTANFALQERGSVSGVVFEDLDGSGRQNSGEPAVPGMTVTLLDGSGAVLQTTQSDARGLYRFSAISLGSYLLRLTVLEGWMAGSAPEQNIALVTGGEAAGASFGLLRAGTLSGVVFHDRNGNGAVDGNESGIPNAAVALMTLGRSILNTATDSNGRYQFAGLAPGAYQVSIAAAPEWIPSGPTRRVVNMGSSGGAVAVFAYQERGTASGVVFQDIDGNGRQDSTEPSLEGMTVQALSNGALVSSAVSDGNGRYTIAGLLPGTVLLQLVVPAGFAPVSPAEQSVLLFAQSAVHLNFGLQPVSTIAGVLYEDRNGDTVRQQTEVGLSGIVVSLYSAGPDGMFETGDELFVREVRTASDGAYQFLNQVPGAYEVRSAVPAGYTATGADSIVVNLAQVWTAAANFGWQRSNSVAATTYEDFNGNGVQDENEPALANLPVVLRLLGAVLQSAASQNSYTATTSSAGSAIFRDVTAGTYELRTQPPDGGDYVALRSVANVSIAPDGKASEQFGFLQIGTVSGSISDDSDGSGMHNGDEPGLGGVHVQLLDGNGALLAEQDSAIDGSYLFSQLAAGQYQLQVIAPSGYVMTASPSPISLSAEGIDAAATLNIGFATTDSILGRVFFDLNRSQIQERGETGVAGVTVTLRTPGAADRIVKTSLTGLYRFESLAPGDYEVVVTLPPDFTRTTELNQAVRVDGVSVAAARFGIRPNLPSAPTALDPTEEPLFSNRIYLPAVQR